MGSHDTAELLGECLTSRRQVVLPPGGTGSGQVDQLAGELGGTPHVTS
jgi:hypothetical protein